MNKNLRILKWIYTEATIASVVRKLSDKGKRNAKYKWISSVQPNESLAIRVGRTNFTDFEDSRLIQELKSRGFFKEV